MINLKLSEKTGATNVKDYAYRTVRENVLDLNLLPGTLISENSLAEALSMSRTPIREAISRLVNEEVLEVYPQRGTYVSMIDMKRVNEAVFARSNLESEAVKLACESFTEEDIYILESNINRQEFANVNNQLLEIMKLDDELHEYFFLGNHMQHLWQLLQNISTDYYRIRYIKVTSGLRLEETIDEHKRILGTIKNRDAENACATIKKHINMLYKDAAVVRKEHPEYFK